MIGDEGSFVNETKKMVDEAVNGMRKALAEQDNNCMSLRDTLIKKTYDNIHHPKRYTRGTIEVWDFIVDKKMNYLEGNVIKYVSRYKDKGGKEDLLKAKAYLDKLIEGYDDSEV